MHNVHKSEGFTCLKCIYTVMYIRICYLYAVVLVDKSLGILGVAQSASLILTHYLIITHTH